VQDRWQRWGPLSGIAYVVLFLVGIFAGGEGAGDSPEEHVAYYADSGNRAKEFLLFFILVAAGLLLLWFLAGLRNVLVRAEGGELAGPPSPSEPESGACRSSSPPPRSSSRRRGRRARRTSGR
jgi:hypothetical protein